MRVAALALLVPSLAVADPVAPRDVVGDALASPAAFVAALGDRVKLGAIAFDDPACAARFAPGTVQRADRGELARCVLALDPHAMELELGSPVAALGSGGVLLGIELARGRIVAIGPVAPDARDRALPTFYGRERFDASPATRATIAKLGRGVHAAMKVCSDASGAITTRRLVVSSKLVAYNKELVAHFAAQDRREPRQLDGRAIASCSILAFDPGKEIVQPVKIEKSGDDGEVNGSVSDGPDGDVPPPPPPPPNAPQNVAPTVLEALRISGEKNITPDDDTKTLMARGDKSKFVTSYKVCVDTSGAVTHVVMLKSSGYPDYDAKLIDGIHGWRYRPFEVNGKVVPVCTAVTFIYNQH